MQAFIAGYCEISLIKSVSERRNYFEPGTAKFFTLLLLLYRTLAKIKELSQIVLETLNLLNQLETRKNKFIEISVDGKITEDEIRDFVDIKIELERISMAIDSLKLWTQKMLSNGSINEDVYKRIESELKASM